MALWEITIEETSNSPNEKPNSGNGKTAEIRNGIVAGKTLTWK
jgi:hypothetical protein